MVYAVNNSDDTGVAIDPATYTVAVVASTGPAPAHVIDAPNGKVYVTNTGDGTVSVYQGPGLQPVGRIQLGDMPHGLRAAAGGSVIVVANTMAGALDLGRPRHRPVNGHGARGRRAGPGRRHRGRALRLRRHHQPAGGGES
jgi:DNA-binding beta-propeller fold protein YncE